MSVTSPSFPSFPSSKADPSGPSGPDLTTARSSDSAWAESSRAAEVLDQLIRDRQRRPLFRRGGALPWGRAGGSTAPEPARPEVGVDVAVEQRDVSRRPRRASGVRSLAGVDVPRMQLPARRTLLAAAAVVLVLLAFFGRHLLMRPPSLDASLPIASQDATGSGGVSTTTVAASTDGAATEATPGGSATSADGAGAASAAASVMVHVAGAVASPGVVRLGADARVVDAVSAAGGLRADADPDRVNLAAPLVDGSRIVVPVVGQAPPTEVVSVPSSPTGVSNPADGAAGAAGVTVSAPIDLNTATVAELDELPGVGPTTAQAIVDHRDSEGRFTSVDALLDVRGIGDAKLAAIRDLVTVG